MSDQELIWLPMMIDMVDGRLTVAAAAVLLGLGRRQVFRLRHTVMAEGTAGLTSYRRGRLSNRRRSKTFRRTVLALVRATTMPVPIQSLVLPGRLLLRPRIWR